MAMNSSSQGVYAPLPQSLSDSDSEKEMPEPTTRINFSVNTRKMQNGHDPRVTHNGYSIPNHVINMKAKRGFGAMSPARKCAFVFSIVLCFVVVIVFLWVMPCSSQGTCPMRISSWKNDHEGMEFKGRVNVIREVYGNSVSLALLAKKPVNSFDNHSGAVALKSSTGALLWFVPHIHPYELNCNLIDLNKDGVNDCLLLGEIGLEAIDPITSEVIWYAHNKNTVLNIDFPKIIPDLNKDGISEMISVGSSNSNSETHNKVVLINGQTGEVIKSTNFSECRVISNFKYEDEFFIYLCENDLGSNYFKFTLKEIKTFYLETNHRIKTERIEYHPKSEEDFILNGRRLLIDNFGKCPQCSTRISILEESSQKSLYDSTYDKTYTMKPISFAFKKTQENVLSLKGHINGFILKMWQWSPESRTASYINYNTTQKFNISEKVVLITFNDTNVHVINVSYIPLTQFCFPTRECQPDLTNSNDSLLISDLDLDGSQELISYSSTYKCAVGDSYDKCQLVSSVQVIRLEAELPKLYTK